jgi:integrase
MTKAGTPQTVVLVAPAVVVLQVRQVEAVDSEWVFPGRHAGRYLGEPGRAWKVLIERAGIKDLRIHDLRRTLGSWAAAGGASLQVIGKALGHHDISTTLVYSRLNLDPVRVAVDGAVQAMLAAAEKPTERRALPAAGGADGQERHEPDDDEGATTGQERG